MLLHGSLLRGEGGSRTRVSVSRQAHPPTLLLTKLHPPFVPAQTVARERLFARLREGRGRRLSLVACPAGFGKSTLLAAWREHELAQRPVAWVTLDGATTTPSCCGRTWSRRCAAPAPGSPTRSWPRRPPARRCSRSRCRGSSTRCWSRRTSCSCSTTSTGCQARPRARASRGSSSTCPRRSSSCSPPAPTRRCRSARCAPTASCVELRADDLRFTLDGGRRVPQRAARAGARRATTSSCSSRAPRAGRPASTSPRCRWPARTTSRRSSGPSTARARTSSTSSSSEVLDGFDPELQAFMLRTSVLERLCAPLCDAVARRAGSAAALESLARTNLFLLPLDDRRRWFRFHHLFAQLLRVELRAARAGELVPELHGARTRGTASTARPTRRSTTRSRPAPRRGGRADRRELGALRQRRPHVVGPRLAAARSPPRCSPATGGCCSCARGSRRCAGSEADMRAALARVRALGGLDDGPLPDGFASLGSSLSVLSAAFAWGDVGRCSSTARGRRSSRGRSRRGGRWSRGRSAGRTTATATSTRAERWLRRRRRSRRRPSSGSSASGAIADLSLIAGMRGRRDEQRRLADEALELARDHGLLDAREVGEVHTAQGVALAARGPPRRGAARARAGRLPAPAVGAAARPRRRADRARPGGRRRRRRRARRRAVRRGRGAAGRLPGPGRPARAARRRAARGARAATPLSERERDDPALPRRRAHRARDRAASCSSPSTPSTAT